VVHSDLRAEGLSRRDGETRRETRRGEEATWEVGAEAIWMPLTGFGETQ